MRRRIFLLLPTLVLLDSNVYAGYPTKRFTISARSKEGLVGYLSVAAGELVLYDPSWRREKFDKDAYDRWYVLGSKIKSSTDGTYLAYDPTGKNNKVFLAATADDEGTDWTIDRQRFGVQRKNERRDSGEWGYLHAASGAVKGWYFDVEGDVEFTRNAQSDKTRHFVVSKEPSANVEVARIYTTSK